MSDILSSAVLYYRGLLAGVAENAICFRYHETTKSR